MIKCDVIKCQTITKKDRKWIGNNHAEGVKDIKVQNLDVLSQHSMFHL